ncbi:MAG: ATP phosphoribosyltransferase regulatory subunit [Roseobacter sp.]
MTERSRVLAQAAQLRAGFEKAGAQPVETSILQPAETLLDLYGEDIRARAYITSDALRGEQMLRPDFTVPVVQMHMAGGADPARYTYAGDVFRRQEHDPQRSSEYMQVGFEVFDGSDPAAADAEVFALMNDAMRHLRVRAVSGDIGLLTAAVRGLQTTSARKEALLRHIWRPRRFRSLLHRYAGRNQPSAERLALLSGHDVIGHDVPLNGKRTRAEIEARLAVLREDARTPAVSEAEVDLIDALLSVKETLPFALEHLRDLAVDLPAIDRAVEQLARRTEALAQRGIKVETLAFEAGFGRTAMEYYDGFVFAFFAQDRADLPPVATGGRYDALTRRLGGGREIPAVGGVLRPGVMLDLEGAP